MKKLLFSVFIMSILFTAQAGYVINGISVNNADFGNLMNYTLLFDGSGNPIAAGTMNVAPGSGRNNIAILRISRCRYILFHLGG
ncbi:MAG: hypothetical protein FWG84_03685 [Bacteroidales bacterium]|nr:hypothetical protein [Bacteroidales bacterium]